MSTAEDIGKSILLTNLKEHLNIEQAKEEPDAYIVTLLEDEIERIEDELAPAEEDDEEDVGTGIRKQLHRLVLEGTAQVFMSILFRSYASFQVAGRSDLTAEVDVYPSFTDTLTKVAAKTFIPWYKRPFVSRGELYAQFDYVLSQEPVNGHSQRFHYIGRRLHEGHRFRNLSFGTLTLCGGGVSFWLDDRVPENIWVTPVKGRLL